MNRLNVISLPQLRKASSSKSTKPSTSRSPQHQPQSLSLPEYSLIITLMMILIMMIPTHTNAKMSFLVPKPCNQYLMEVGTLYLCYGCGNNIFYHTSQTQHYFSLTLQKIRLREGGRPQIALSWGFIYARFIENSYRTVSTQPVQNLATSFKIKTITTEPSQTYQMRINYLALSVDNNMEIYIDYYWIHSMSSSQPFVYDKVVSNPNNIDDLTIITFVSFVRLKIDDASKESVLEITSVKKSNTEQTTTFKTENLFIDQVFIYYVSFYQGLTTQQYPQLQYKVIKQTSGDIYYPSKLPTTEKTFFAGMNSVKFKQIVFYNSIPQDIKFRIYKYIDKYTKQLQIVTVIIPNYQSYQCQPLTYCNMTIKKCKPCPNYCLTCNSQGKCLSCKENFTVSDDGLSCECNGKQITGICFDVVPIQFVNCVTMLYDDLGNLKCIDCLRTKKLFPVNNTCACMKGYQLKGQSDCVEICGDGILTDDECDDNNTADKDGCSSKCKVEKGFQCFNSPGQPSNCKYNANIRFSIFTILKNENQNSAIITLKLSNKNLPFALLPSQFASDLSLQPEMLSLELSSNTSRSNSSSKRSPHNITLKGIKGKFMTLLIRYDFTIEGMNSTLFLNFSQTKYLSKKQQLKFTMRGANSPLIVVTFVEHYEVMEIILFASTIISMIILATSSLLPKYIGLEFVLLLEQIYLSQMLYTQQDQWPGEFRSFTGLRYSTGFPITDPYTTYTPLNAHSKKMSFLSIKKTYLDNVFFNTLLITAIFVIFLAYSCAVNLSQDAQQKKQKKNQNAVAIAPKMKDVLITKEHQNLKVKKFQKKLFVSEVLYRLLSQVATWCIFPALYSFAAWRLIPNDALTFISKQQAWQTLANRLIPFFLLVIVIIIISEHTIGSLFLNPITIGRLKRKKAEFRYRKLNLVYMFVLGMLVCYGNDVEAKIGFGCPNIPMSLLVLILHALYMALINLKVRPYSETLIIHSVTLFLNQFVYLVFLVLVTLMNMWKGMPVIVILAISYVITASCLVIIVLSIIRLYYQFKYGQDYQIDKKEQKLANQQAARKKQQQRIDQELQALQLQANKKADRKNMDQIVRDKNQYLYQNQKKQDQKEDLMLWLSTRQCWTEQMKDAYYFKYFDQKPLSWIKANQKQKYHKIRKQIQKESNIRFQKEQERKKTKQYQEAKEQLQESYKKMKKRQQAVNKLKPHQIKQNYEVLSYDEKGNPFQIKPIKKPKEVCKKQILQWNMED